MIGNLKENAIWVSSYPKSGNTWMMLSLQAAQLDGCLDDLNSTEEKGQMAAHIRLFEEALDINPSDLTAQEQIRWRPEALQHFCAQLSHPTFLKIHDNARLLDGRWLLPMDKTRAIIHLVRDPRDIALSWADHSGINLDQSIDFLCRNDACLTADLRSGATQVPQFIGNWTDHCQSWLDAAKASPILMLRYEDRLLDPESSLRNTLSFIGLDKTDDIIHRTLAATSFDALRKLENKAGFRDKPPGVKNFFRRGKSGTWKENLSDQQIARIENAHGDMMRTLGYI